MASPFPSLRTAVAIGAGVLIAVALAAQAAAQYRWAQTGLFALDDHVLYEAARELIRTGVPRTTYLPHSTDGWDVFLWTFYLPVYWFAAAARIFASPATVMFGVGWVEYAALVAGILLFFHRFLAPAAALAAAAVVLLDPEFASVTGQHVHAPPLMFGLFAVLAFDAAVASPLRRAAMALAAAAGALCAAAVLSFAPVGLPFVAGIGLAFLLEAGRDRRDRRRHLASFAAFVAGGGVVLAIFLGDVWTRLDAASLRDLVVTVASHPADASGLARRVLSSGYFFAGLLVSPLAPTLLPAWLLMLLLAVRTGAGRSEREGRFLRLAGAITLGWLIGAMVIPAQHVSAARMVLLSPLYVVVVAQAWRRPAFRLALPAVAAAACAIVATTVAFGLMGQPGAPYGIGIAAAVALILAAAAALLVGRPQGFKRFAVQGVAAAFALVLLASTVVNEGSVLRTAAAIARQSAGQPSRMDVLGPEVLAITTPLLQPGQRVLTNMPMEEFFPAGVRRQLIRFYRGLISGATGVPADRLVLIGLAPGTDIYPDYADVQVGTTVYFRGFDYCVTERVDVTAPQYVLLGIPAACPGNGPVARGADDLSAEDVAAYIGWRRSRGLPVN